MQTTADLINLASNPKTLQRKCYQSPSEKPQMVDSKIQALSEELMVTAIPMFAAYTNDFSQKWSENLEDFASELAERLLRNQVGRKGLHIGMERFKKQCTGRNKWMINPEEFAQLCKPKPEDLGIAPLKACIDEIQQARAKARQKQEHTYSHRVVELMDSRIGYNIYATTAAEFEKLAATEYDYWTKRALNRDLPEKTLAALEDKREPDLPEHLKNAKPIAKNTPFGKRLAALGQGLADRKRKVAQ